MSNIAIFSEVREPFLGDVDPLASVKTAFSELNIKERIAYFYTQTPSQENDANSSVILKEEKTDSKEQRRPAKSVPNIKPEKAEQEDESYFSTSVDPPINTVLTAAATPSPQLATPKPVVADQFQPIIVETKSKESVQSAKPSVKPSSAPVWETADTVLERPIRYD
jgi:hypothetical protein